MTVLQRSLLYLLVSTLCLVMFQMRVASWVEVIRLLEVMA